MPPPRIRAADAAKGHAAEHTFRHWLDASVLPHLYVEQSPLTVPAPLRGQIKRPDYLVGIPGVGLVAFDVKAKTLYAEGLIFDLEVAPVFVSKGASQNALPLQMFDRR